MCVAVYFYIDIALLARLSTSSQVGLYDAAYRFMLLGILLPSAVITSVYALAAELAATDRERFGELARELLSLSALLLPLPVIVLCADPEGVLRLLYGDAFAGGAPALRWLGAGIALTIASGVVGPLLIAVGQERATLPDRRRRRGVQPGGEPRADPVAGRRGCRDRDARRPRRWCWRRHCGCSRCAAGRL